jgi:hypothetical protein
LRYSRLTRGRIDNESAVTEAFAVIEVEHVRYGLGNLLEQPSADSPIRPIPHLSSPHWLTRITKSDLRKEGGQSCWEMP